MISLLIMKRKIIHPMEGKVSFYRMNAFYISLLTMKSSMTFGTVYKARQFLKNDSSNVNWKKIKYVKAVKAGAGTAMGHGFGSNFTARLKGTLIGI
jgi:hypothetical protein